jgi:hypothetical protein
MTVEKLTDTFLTRMLFDALDTNDQTIKSKAIADAVTVIEKNPRVGTEYMMKRMVDAFGELEENTNSTDDNMLDKFVNIIEQQSLTEITDKFAKIIERQRHKISNDFALHLTGQMIENDHLAKSLQSVLQATLKAQPEFPALVVEEANYYLYDFVQENQRKNALAIIDTAITIAPHQTVTEDLVKNLTRRAIVDTYPYPYEDNQKIVQTLSKAIHIRHDFAKVAEKVGGKLSHDYSMKIATASIELYEKVIRPVLEMPCANVAADKLHLLAHGL